MSKHDAEKYENAINQAPDPNSMTLPVDRLIRREFSGTSVPMFPTLYDDDAESELKELMSLDELSKLAEPLDLGEISLSPNPRSQPANTGLIGKLKNRPISLSSARDFQDASSCSPKEFWTDSKDRLTMRNFGRGKIRQGKNTIELKLPQRKKLLEIPNAESISERKRRQIAIARLLLIELKKES